MRARRPFLAACLAAITGLTGCAVKKPPTAPQIVQQSLPATTKIRDQWASPAASGLVQDGWLKTLSDPQAEAVVEEVLRNNLDLRVAATRVEVAADIATQAHAQLLPNVVVQGSAKVSGRFENKRFNSWASSRPRPGKSISGANCVTSLLPLARVTRRRRPM